jgi:hypothetical protein
LFAATDLFVIYDCVGFPKRGWVHRNRLRVPSGAERWLTLPLEKTSRSTLIRDLRFPANAGELLGDRLRKFSLAGGSGGAEDILAALRDVGGHPVDYIERLLERTVRYCGIPWNVVRSTSLNVPADVRGQDRILEIMRRLGARSYVNASGGRAFYDPRAFAEAGIKLRFLPDYAGPHVSILTRILSEDRDVLIREILASARLGSAADLTHDFADAHDSIVR